MQHCQVSSDLTNRRSPRVLARIPISLTAGHVPPVAALTAVINRHGALLLSALPYDVGAVLRLQNELTLTATDCLVVWVGEADPSGGHKLGVEFVNAAAAFVCFPFTLVFDIVLFPWQIIAGYQPYGPRPWND